jgi:hypothetical protein
MESEAENFSDPALKSAVQKAWSGERAPEALRQRIAGATSGSSIEAPQVGFWRGRLPLYGLAAAALVLLCVGLVFRASRSGRDRSTPTPAVALNDTLAAELVARHDACCKAEDHHMPGLPQGDFAAIAAAIRQRLGYPILSVALPDGWQFHGAAICPVGNTDSGHLLFQRDGNQFVSIFSLPASFAAQLPASSEFDRASSDHPMAGFATAHGFYCVLGSSPDGSVTIDQVRALRDRLRTDVAIASAPDFSRITVAASR